MGKYGLRLLSKDFSKYRRYGSPVMEVNDLSANDLVKLQNDAFVTIYAVPWRIIPLLRKHGVGGVLLTLFRLLKMTISVIQIKVPTFFKQKKGLRLC